MLGKARTLLKVLNILNRTIGVALALFCLTMGFILADRLPAILARTNHAVDPANVVQTLRLGVLAVSLMIWLVHRVLRGLIAIIDTIPVGRAFSAENAQRLREVGWFMLGINLLDLGYGLFAVSRLGPFSGWSFTLSGWIACLMIFILASVWQQGVQMRDELEGTV